MIDDLIGYIFTGDDGEEWIVVGPASWSENYVEVERINSSVKHYSVRPTSLVIKAMTNTSSGGLPC